MFASVKKSAYLSGFCPHLFIGVHSGLASTAALLLPFSQLIVLLSQHEVSSFSSQDRTKAIVANLATKSGFCRVPGEQTLPLGNVEPGEEKRRHEDRHRSTRTAPRGPVPRNPEHPDQAREHPGVVRDEEVPLSGLRARLLSGT